jgi:NitT/TauT family transport system substrate-binding protein
MQMKKNWYIVIVVIGIVLLCAVAWYLQTPPSPWAPEESLTIASGSQEFSSLTQIADEKGYFRKYGLNVTIRYYPTGVTAMNELLAGNADLACAAEFVGVSTSFKSADFRIISTTAKSDVNALIIRNDRGISKPSDLKGKTIAFPKGTVAEFFLGRYLALNGLEVSDVTVRYLNPAELVGSLDRGDSDAVIIWEPFVYQITQKLGRNVTVWPAQSGQRFYWVVYTRPDIVRNKPEVIRKYLQSLDDAKTFINTNEPEANAILQRRMNLTDDYMDNLWKKNRFGLSLDQSLIVAMEDESRWMIQNNLTTTKVMPNYLDYIYTSGMSTVKPESMDIITVR